MRQVTWDRMSDEVKAVLIAALAGWRIGDYGTGVESADAVDDPMHYDAIYDEHGEAWDDDWARLATAAADGDARAHADLADAVMLWALGAGKTDA